MELIKVERKDLVVGVEYILDGSRTNRAYFVGVSEESQTVYFISDEETPYHLDSEGFIPFPLTGDPFFKSFFAI
jgi:hypothetical protein